MEGPVSIYLRLVDYNSSALTSNGTHDTDIATIKDTFDTDNKQFIRVSGYHCDVEQTLNIGSQSTGAGAGRITFNPFRITKFIDGTSPILFQNSASGTPFKTAEVFFVNEKNVLQVRQTYKLVAVKTISWSATAGENGIIETLTFEYGGLMITVFQQGTDGEKSNVLLAGWNRVRNTSDNDLKNVII